MLVRLRRTRQAA